MVEQTLTKGQMQLMALGLTSAEIQSVVIYLTGKSASPSVVETAPPANLCAKADRIRGLNASAWNGWSPDLENTRFQPHSKIRASDVPRLAVKWTFAYPGSKNTQVTAIGNRLFVGSSAGQVYSLNADTGCTYWRYDAPGGVRAAVTIAKLKSAPSGYAAFVSDSTLVVHALDAISGQPVWSSAKLEQHRIALLTGAAAIYKGVLYVPVSSGEEVLAGRSGYVCCSFRGSVIALDAETGRQIWKTYTIPEEPHTYREGKPQTGPAGAAVWSAPTIDVKRGLLYVGTGDSYTDVQTDRADAILALELSTGRVVWSNQATEGDNFIVGCFGGSSQSSANCPSPVGPDHDFGSSPILRRSVHGTDIIVAGQKSGQVYGLDANANGRTLWKVRLGQGGPAGGVEWGMTADRESVYVPVADVYPAGGHPGMNALNLASGEVRWKTPTPKHDCPAGRRCTVGQSAPASSIDGVAFSGAVDGHLRAYDTRSGTIIWDFDTTAMAYDTVNGIKGAKGGVLDATGPSFTGKMMFQHSGYPGVMAVPTLGLNLLMAFSVNGK